ncbi:MAG TPA: cytochrome c oxidase subunit II [Steroidobacteraceae bacterium]|jgi:cytochrome c oxidase subunit 2|nr:cytochrome c oxidase subunit II [Steroidobacteraceae bacterium]
MNPFDPFPPAASTMAPQVDHLFIALLAMCGLVAVTITVVIVVFVVRYRRGSRADRSNPPTGAFWLEVGWAGTPLAVFFVVFIWSTSIFSRFYRPPADSTQIYVMAKQWMWRIQHANGRREINQLHVPLGYPVKLIMSSQDVIHSFYVPAFRIKQDVLPGRFTYLWFQPTQLGRFTFACAQFCGIQHYAMGGQVIVMRPADYERWLAAGSEQPGLVARGAALFRQSGCSGCHEPGSSVHAPDLHALYGQPVHLADGSTVLADDNYLLDCMLEPANQRVLGYAPVMPSFKGQLTQDDLDALITFIKSGQAP